MQQQHAATTTSMPQPFEAYQSPLPSGLEHRLPTPAGASNPSDKTTIGAVRAMPTTPMPTAPPTFPTSSSSSHVLPKFGSGSVVTTHSSGHGGMRATDGQIPIQLQQHQAHVQPIADESAAAQLQVTLQMLARQVQRSAEAAQGAVERAEALCKQAVDMMSQEADSSDGIDDEPGAHAATSAQGLGPLTGHASLTQENLRNHIRSLGNKSATNSQRHHSPPPAMNAELPRAAGGTMPGEQGSQLAGWSLTGAVEAGTSELHLQSYANLRVGDILELSPGLPTAGIVKIVRFGSVFVASPLRLAHARGTQVRRVVEGSGPSFEAHRDAAAQPRSRPHRKAHSLQNPTSGRQLHIAWR